MKDSEKESYIKKIRRYCSLLVFIFCFLLLGMNIFSLPMVNAEPMMISQSIENISDIEELGETKIVTTWDEFVDALGNTDVSLIEIDEGINRIARGTSSRNPGTISRDLVIRGNGSEIDFGTTGTPHIILGNVASPTTLIVDDVMLTKNSGNNVFYQGTAANTSNWNIALQNVLTGTGANQRGLVYAARAFVTVYGENNVWTVGDTGSNHLYVGNFTLDDEAKLIAKTREGATSGASYPVILISDSISIPGSVILGENSSLTIVNDGRTVSRSDVTEGSSGISGFIKEFTMKTAAKADIRTYYRCYATSGATATTGITTTFQMAHSSEFHGESRRSQVIKIGPVIGGSSPDNQAIINIGDEEGGATLTAIGHCAANSPTGVSGVETGLEHDHAAITIKGENNRINLKSNSVFSALNDYDMVMIIQGSGNIFTVEKNAKLNITSNGSTNGYCAALRFYISGGQTFNIDGGEVNVTKIRGPGSDEAAAAIRLYSQAANGAPNAINVKNGGKFYVYNDTTSAGNTATDGLDSNGREGINYRDARTTSNSNAEPHIFSLEGANSSVEIIATNGPAINSNGAINVTAGKGTVFIMKGRTDSASAGALNEDGSGRNLNFVMDEPLYFDFRNNCTATGGGPAVYARTSSSSFITSHSDLSVWRRTGKISEMDGTPTANWTLFDYELRGTNLAYYSSSSSSFNATTYNNAELYSRMSANNAKAVIDEIRVPTNADKYIYGHAGVPEGLGELRDAWTNEVYVTVQVKDTLGNVVFEKEGITAGRDDANPEGVSIYGEEARGGIFKILYDPDGDSEGDYLPTGYTIEVISAYRSSSGNVTQVSEEGIHRSEAKDLQAGVVTVRDVTPPKELKLENLNNQAASQISVQTKVISGTSDELGATVYLYKNGVLWKDDAENPATGIVGSDQKWSITLPGTLQEDDKVEIALNDNQPWPTDLTDSDTEILTNEGIFANNGNENPAEILEFHDAVFNKRLELTAVWIELCPYILNVHDNTLINAKGDTVTTGIVFSGDTITLSPQAFEACDSDHTHELIVEGQAENKTVLLEGSSTVPYNVYINGVYVKQMTIQSGGEVFFGADESNLDNCFKNTTAPALVIDANVTGVTIKEDSSVTAYANSDIEPISIEGGKMKILDLIMNKTKSSDIILEIAGENRKLPAQTARIAVMDNLDGNWLSGNMEVKDPVSDKNYVRGISVQISEGVWDSDEDSSDYYSDKNHYGNTFALDKEANTAGTYQAVRLPVPEKYLSVTVPVRVRFGMQLDGEAGSRGNTNWHSIPQPATNSSYSYEDTSLDSGKRFNMKAHEVKFYYNGLGVSAQEKAENGYQLKAYDVVWPVADATGVEKPMLALLGCTEILGSEEIEMDEDEVLDTPEFWFTMPAGTVADGNTEVTAFTTQLYLSRPKNAGVPVNDYYQYPGDRSKSLSGIHRLNLVIAYQES